MAKAPKPKDVQADPVLDDTAATVAAQVTHFDAAQVAAAVSRAGDGRIAVRALQPTRWRAGRCFTAAETVEIALADLGGAQVEALMADPLLMVTVIEAGA